MGSGFSTCTIKEAGTLLGRSQRSIRLYIKQGFLRKALDDKGNICVLREDINSLLIEQNEALPALNKQNFFGLLSRVRKLEQDMTVIRRAFEIRTEPLRVKKEEALALYNEASISLKIRQDKWTIEEVKTWANLFDRFDASTLEAMPDKKRPWEIFYKLCIELMVHESKTDDNTLWTALDQGRKNLRNEAILWIEMGKGTFPKETYFGLNSEKEAILASLLGSKAIESVD